jgi:methionyl-tRNA formyltransferase
LEQGSVTAKAQPEVGANYASKVSKEEAALDFSQPAEVLARKVRAFNPFPGTFALFNQVPIKIWNAEALSDTLAKPGHVVAANAQDGVIVGCTTGALRLTELQKPGGKRLAAAEFLKGFPLADGQFT